MRIGIVGNADAALALAIEQRLKEKREIQEIKIEREPEMFSLPFGMYGRIMDAITGGPSFEGYVNYRLSKSNKSSRGARTASQRSRSRRRRCAR